MFVARCTLAGCGWESRQWPRRNGPGKDGDNHVANKTAEGDWNHDYIIAEVA